GPAVERLDRFPPLLSRGAAHEERRTAAGHLPAMTKPAREILHSGVCAFGRRQELVRRLASRLVPRLVNARGREFDTRPGDGIPGWFDRDRHEAFAGSFRERTATFDEERDVRAHSTRDDGQVDDESVNHCCCPRGW